MLEGRLDGLGEVGAFQFLTMLGSSSYEAAISPTVRVPCSMKSISCQQFLKGAALGAAGAVSSAIADEQTGDNSASDWLGEAPVVDDADIVNELEADILVIGGGHSGICCARKAAELGKSVIVMEKMAEDMYSPIGCDMAAVNADYFLEQGCDPIDPTEVLNEWLRRTYSRANPTLIREFCQRSGECANWIRSLVPQWHCS